MTKGTGRSIYFVINSYENSAVVETIISAYSGTLTSSKTDGIVYECENHDSKQTTWYLLRFVVGSWFSDR